MLKEFLLFKFQLSFPHSAYLGRAEEALTIFLLIYLHIFQKVAGALIIYIQSKTVKHFRSKNV